MIILSLLFFCWSIYELLKAICQGLVVLMCIGVSSLLAATKNSYDRPNRLLVSRLLVVLLLLSPGDFSAVGGLGHMGVVEVKMIN